MSVSARNRGKAEERRIARLFGSRRRGPTGYADSDLEAEFPLSVSVKNSSRYGILGNWVEEAQGFGRRENKNWILVVRRKSKKKATVTCDLDFFLSLWND